MTTKQIELFKIHEYSRGNTSYIVVPVYGPFEMPFHENAETYDIPKEIDNKDNYSSTFTAYVCYNYSRGIEIEVLAEGDLSPYSHMFNDPRNSAYIPFDLSEKFTAIGNALRNLAAKWRKDPEDAD